MVDHAGDLILPGRRQGLSHVEIQRLQDGFNELPGPADPFLPIALLQSQLHFLVMPDGGAYMLGIECLAQRCL